MVYRIWPSANFVNEEIDLEYEFPPGDRSWLDYVMKEEPIPGVSVPKLILNNRPEPLPAAFEIANGFWCVAAEVKDRMKALFGSQVAFHEVSAVVNADRAPLPPTYFVTFCNFRSAIDWRHSKTKERAVLHDGQEIKFISLADVPHAAVFEAMPNDEMIIWIEKRLDDGNRSYSPGFAHVYTTNTAARVVSEAFPGRFELTAFDEAHYGEAYRTSLKHGTTIGKAQARVRPNRN